MELKKLMEHISISPITDKPGKWNINYRIFYCYYLCRYFWCGRLGRYRGFWGTHLDFLKQYGDFENGIPVHEPLPELYPVSVLQNFTSALLMDA